MRAAPLDATNNSHPAMVNNAMRIRIVCCRFDCDSTGSSAFTHPETGATQGLPAPTNPRAMAIEALSKKLPYGARELGP